MHAAGKHPDALFQEKQLLPHRGNTQYLETLGSYSWDFLLFCMFPSQEKNILASAEGSAAPPHQAIRHSDPRFKKKKEDDQHNKITNK